jgi:thioredoxin reductase (NADPH)
MFELLANLASKFAPAPGYAAYGLALVGLWLTSGLSRWHRERKAAGQQQRAIETGSSEPVSLHPVIDPARCVGCSACTNACPEGKIIGMIGGKAQLLDPGSCIGHGACKSACPVDAIDLVFGTARRGVDIPVVSTQFESNVPGLFIAGELGGMGLIANAIEQGRQAVGAIARHDNIGTPEIFDVVIVGGGPAGIAATLAAKEKQLRYLTFEQDTFGGTVARYPRAKLVMTRTAHLPLYGKVRLRRVRKERLLALWQKVLQQTGAEIQNGVRVERIVPQPFGFEVTTSNGVCRTATVLLATGRRGSPRRLGVPGEELSKVVFSLDDPAQYQGQRVLVVGGGDSALEAAIAVSRQPGAQVSLCYRGTGFDRAKPVNRRRLEEAMRQGRVTVMFDSEVRSIQADQVAIEKLGHRQTLLNDAVIICVGGVLPTAFLAEIGVLVETKYGSPMRANGYVTVAAQP